MSASIGPDENEEVALETLIERARREGGELLASFKRRTFAPREKLDAWRLEVARGDRARAFLAGDFWRRDLEPFLRVEGKIKPCPPDALPASLERATIEYLDKSGAARQVDRIEKTMKEWVAVGEKAAVLLRGEAEKRNGVGATRG